jgi:hypothetical protein
MRSGDTLGDLMVHSPKALPPYSSEHFAAANWEIMNTGRPAKWAGADKEDF